MFLHQQNIIWIHWRQCIHCLEALAPAGTITLNPRWIHVMAWRCFHVDIWFYLKIESTSGFPRWFHVMFSTLIPRVFHVESTFIQRWINVRFSTLNHRQDITLFPHWYLVIYESWFHVNVMFSTLNPHKKFQLDRASFPSVAGTETALCNCKTLAPTKLT